MARPTPTKRKIEANRFVGELLKNGGDATNAVLAVTPMKKPSAIRRGQRLLERPDVKTLIREAMAKNGVDFNFVFNARKTIVDKGMERVDSMKITASDVHNQLSGMEKLLLALDNKQQAPTSNRFFFGNTTYNETADTHTSKLTPLQDIIDAEDVEPLE